MTFKTASKPKLLAALAPLALFAAFQVTPARADGEPATLSSVKIEEPPTHTSSACDQLITLSAGPFQPDSVVIGNGRYQFDYGSRPTTFQAQLAWALKLADLAGGVYFEGALSLSTFSGTAVQSQGSDLTTASYGFGLLGLDARLMYAGDWFPWKPLVPFVDGGYRYSVYYQPGASGLESVQGGVGNPVAGGGLRFWLNRRASMGGAMPWFVTARIDRIFPQQNSLNLASTSISGGLTLGL